MTRKIFLMLLLLSLAGPLSARPLTIIIVTSDDGSLLINTPNGPIENKLLPRPQRTFRAKAITP